jgi:cytochrome c oxidase assembly protein subunit 15
MAAPALDLDPLAWLLLLGGGMALVPLLWLGWRYRGEPASERRRLLVMLTLFLTFDLVLFGAFTRLTDSGLGCPDWPGCYGSVTPFGARNDIHAAQSALPTGPVTHGKAWIEMIHRYLATSVGALITWLAVSTWLADRHQRGSGAGEISVNPADKWWAVLAWIWVCLQGAFGALTVTMKLYPAIVTVHLLGGLGLLSLLTVQAQRARPRAPRLEPALYRAVVVVSALALAQIALGGWVSTNYAVLACQEFPTCQGQWWPEMDFDHGFTIARELGAGKDGGYLPFTALTAIHMVHRMGAAVLLVAICLLIWRLIVTRRPGCLRWALALGAVIVWQIASGLSNVVLAWPLLAALAHTGGAAALVVVMSALLAHWPAPFRGLVSRTVSARPVAGSVS